MLRQIKCKLDGIEFIKKDQVCLAALKEAQYRAFSDKILSKITELVVTVEILPEMEHHLPTLRTVALELELVNYKEESHPRHPGLPMVLDLVFPDDVHYEEAYAIVALYRYLTPKEYGWLFDRMMKFCTTSHYSDDTYRRTYNITAAKRFYAAYLFGFVESQQCVFVPWQSDHAFLTPIPGKWNYIIKWKERLTDATRLNQLNIPLSKIPIQKLFMGDYLDVHRDPKMTKIKDQLLRQTNTITFIALITNHKLTQNSQGNYELVS